MSSLRAKRNYLSIFLGAIVVIAFAVMGFRGDQAVEDVARMAQEPFEGQEEGAALSPESAEKDLNEPVVDTSDWAEYRDALYGYKITYPANDFTEPYIKGGDTRNEPSRRIQNYPDPVIQRLRLSDGEFIVTISIDTDRSDDCSSFLSEENLQSRDGGRIVWGEQGKSEPPPHNASKVLCADAGEAEIYVRVTESFDATSSISEEVLASFEFIN